MIISHNPISEWELKPRCENCRSDMVTPCGTITNAQGMTSDAFRCNNCSLVSSGLSQARLEALENITRGNGQAGWSLNTGILHSGNSSTITTTAINTGATNNAWGNGYDGGMGSNSTIKMSEAINQLTYKLDDVASRIDQNNNNIMMLVYEIQNMLKKIDEANLSNPLTVVANRIKNFELK